MENEKMQTAKFTITKRNNPKITKTIKAIAWTNQKTVFLAADGEIRVFKKFNGNHTVYNPKSPHLLLDNIIGMHPTDNVAMFNYGTATTIYMMNVQTFQVNELPNFDGLLSVAYEPKCLTVADKSGIHTYYVSQGFSKLNIFKQGFISVFTSDLPQPVAQQKPYIVKQSMGVLYLLKYEKDYALNEHVYVLKLWMAPKIYKGYTSKCTFVVPGIVVEMMPLNSRGIVALLTSSNELLIVHVESQTLISEPSGSSLKPYKIMPIGSAAEIIVFENRRIAVVDIADNWKVVYEQKVEQEAGGYAVSGVDTTSDGTVLFNEGTKFCELKGSYVI